MNFWKKNSGIPSECQTVWTLIRPDGIVGPDLGPSCLPRLSVDDTGRQRVNGLRILSRDIKYFKPPASKFKDDYFGVV